MLRAALPKRALRLYPKRAPLCPGEAAKQGRQQNCTGSGNAPMRYSDRSAPVSLFHIEDRIPQGVRSLLFANEKGREPPRNACGTDRPSTRLSRYAHTPTLPPYSGRTLPVTSLRPHPTTSLHRRPVPGATDRPANPTSALIHLHPCPQKKGRPKSGPAGSLPRGEGCMYRLVRKRRRRTVPSYMRGIRC